VKPQEIPPRFPVVTGDIGVYLLRIGSDNQNRVILRMDGRLDAVRMRRASRLLLDAEPLLGCRFVERWWRPYWERLPNLDEVEICPVVETETVQEAVTRFLLGANDPTVGPQIQTCIVRGEFDTIVFRINHEVTDVGAAKELLVLLLSIYDQLARDPAYRPAPNLKGSRSMRQVSRRLTFLEKLKVIRRAYRDWRLRRVPPGDWYFPSSNAPPEGGRIAIRRIDPATFAPVHSFCRQHGFSINDVLIAAFCRALFDIIKPEPGIPLRLRMTADQRRLLPSGMGEGISNLSGGYVLRLIGGLGDTLEETARRVQKEIDSLKKDFLGLGPWITMPLLKWIPFAWTKKLVHRLFVKMKDTQPLPPRVTNAGRMTTDYMVFGDVKATDFSFAGPLTHPPDFQLNFIGIDQTLCLSLSHYESGVDAATIEDLFDRIEQELPGREPSSQERVPT